MRPRCLRCWLDSRWAMLFEAPKWWGYFNLLVCTVGWLSCLSQPKSFWMLERSLGCSTGSTSTLDPLSQHLPRITCLFGGLLHHLMLTEVSDGAEPYQEALWRRALECPKDQINKYISGNPWNNSSNRRFVCVACVHGAYRHRLAKQGPEPEWLRRVRAWCPVYSRVRSKRGEVDGAGEIWGFSWCCTGNKYLSSCDCDPLNRCHSKQIFNDTSAGEC